MRAQPEGVEHRSGACVPEPEARESQSACQEKRRPVGECLSHELVVCFSSVQAVSSLVLGAHVNLAHVMDHRHAERNFPSTFKFQIRYCQQDLHTPMKSIHLPPQQGGDRSADGV